MWLDNNFILLHFVQLASIAAFYTFIVHLFIYSENLVDKVIALNILIFSILDNFGFGGGRNGFIYIQGVGKPDITFSIIFFIGFLLIFRLSSNNKLKSTDFLYLNWIILFCFQVKVFGALFNNSVFISIICPQRRCFKNNKKNKNFLHSSCCFDILVTKKFTFIWLYSFSSLSNVYCKFELVYSKII